MTKRLNHYDQIYIVCPTPRGGHLEHAIETTLALQSATDAKVAILSRVGAKSYAGQIGIGDEYIIECLPSTLDPMPLPARILLASSRLIREYLAIRRQIRNTNATHVHLIAEEPRYPFVRPLRVRGPRVTTVSGIIHNVREHENSSFPARLRQATKLLFARKVEAVFVHGAAQASRLSNLRNLITLQLPVGSLLHQGATADSPLGALCIGEIRRNKGLDFAAQGARVSGIALTVAGEIAELSYQGDLEVLKEEFSELDFRIGFLNSGAFESMLRAARVLILSYSEMEAQSGVLARALSLRKAVICTDLPAFREQAANYAGVRFVSYGDVVELSRLMSGEWISEWYESEDSHDTALPSDIAQQWQSYGAQIAASLGIPPTRSGDSSTLARRIAGP